ncbi:hypothetical protein LTR36_010008 [Oleoguttula mirabilis]|uniref:RRM domain-containing protein n=1 Tax=Oleoguttula mirabilis TaxID=1507867 RepID=A0AAV9JRS7_9PEZI|nr:hypothetical protein LTR36_010008 [Oleoguttula mirabilis]
MSDGPIIVSSNPFGDIKPYCGRIYHSEQDKWGDVLPWEFPQDASRADEEAFLRTFFSDSEIRSRGGAHGEGLGFRFLKQVWYCIALWNLNHKIPAIANEWIQQNQELINDPNVLNFIYEDDASPQTFGCTPQQEKLYGEKLLRWVIKDIQYRVKYPAGEHEAKKPAPMATDTAAKPAAPVTDTNSPKTGPEAVSEPEGLKSAVVSPVGLGAPSTTSNFTKSVPGSVRLPERLPDGPWGSSQPPASATYLMGEGGHVQQLQRPRGNSNNNNRRHGNNSGPGRFATRPNQPYHNQMYQASPQFSTVAPSIGDVPMHPMLNPTRFTSNGSVDFMPSPHQMQQQMPQMYPMHPTQGGPPPSGAYGNAMQQQYGPPFPPPQQMPMPPTGHPATSLPNPYYNSYSMMQDRSNDRYNNRNFSDTDPFPTTEDTSYRRGSGKRRDSEVSRGGKSRGGFASGRGKGSRGRNSFTGPRPSGDMFAGDGQIRYGHNQQSDEYNFAPESYNANRHRRGSTNSQSWRSKNERPQAQQDENTFPGRVFSGPGCPPDSMPAMTGFPPPGLPPADLDEPGSRNGRIDRQTSAVQPLWPTPPSFPQNQATGALHNEDDPRAEAFPGKLLTNNKIGMECGYVTKLVIFDLPPTVADAEIHEALSPSKIENLRRAKSVPNWSGLDHVFVIFENHIAARTALSLSRQITIGGTQLRIEVPKEYWDPNYHMYPGHGAPGMYSSRSGYNKQARQTEKAPTVQQDVATVDAPQEKAKHAVRDTAPSLGEERASGDSTLTARASADGKMLKELLSGDTTPTVSGASTPKGTAKKSKKKNNNKNKKQQQQQPDVRADAIHAAFAGHQRTENGDDHADAKSDTSTGTVIKATPAKDTQTGMRVGAPDTGGDPETSQLTVNPERKTSVQSDDAQTKCEPTFSPEMQMQAQFPKVKIPVGDMAVEAARKPEGEKKLVADAAPQPFRRPAESEEKTAGSEAVTVKADVTSKHADDDDGTKAEARSEPAVAVTAKVDVSTQPAHPEASVSPQKSDDDQPDDSFHTANGSPHGSNDGRKKEGRTSEDSTATVTTVISTPANLDEVSMSAQDDEKSKEKAGASGQARVEVPQASPESPASPKVGKKVPVPRLPKVKMAAPVSGDNKPGIAEHTTQRSVSGPGLSVPPTPAFQTTPSTPAVPSPLEKTAEIGEEPTKKVEKVKGPAQTESLVSIYGKKQKPKKSKATKGKKDKINTAGRSFSDATDAASEILSRAVSGAATPTDGVNERPLPAMDEIFGAAAVMDRTDSKRPSEGATGATAIDTKDHDKAKADPVTGTNLEADTTAASAPDQARSQSKSRGVFGCVINLLRSSQPTQPGTPETKLGESSSQPVSTDSSAQGTHVDQHHELVALPETHTNVNDADIEAEDRSVAPVAQMVPPADDTGSTGRTSQPFRSFRDFHDNDGCRDSGDSGGRTADGAHGDVGLGIDAGDDVLDAESKPKKKKKKAKSKKKKARGDGTTDQPNESLKSPPGPEGSSPFAFEFKANGHPTASDELAHTPSNGLPSVSDVASEASSHTLGRVSSREQTPTSRSASAAESPARSMIAKKIAAQGSSHLVEAPQLRRKQRIASSATKASETTTLTENESNTVYLEGTQAESDDEVGGGECLDRMLDHVLTGRSQNDKPPPMLYMYVGPGKRAQDLDWETEKTEGTEKRLEEAAEQKLGPQGHDENAKPEKTTATRKGG